jgi:hypothetical protein
LATLNSAWLLFLAPPPFSGSLNSLKLVRLNWFRSITFAAASGSTVDKSILVLRLVD